VGLAKPLKRVNVPDVPLPLSPALQDAVAPTEEKILKP
jgi:pyruvate/2-oxoglutarate/acetoin dehydrogenase E1 component